MTLPCSLMKYDNEKNKQTNKNTRISFHSKISVESVQIILLALTLLLRNSQ